MGGGGCQAGAHSTALQLQNPQEQPAGAAAGRAGKQPLSLFMPNEIRPGGLCDALRIMLSVNHLFILFLIRIGYCGILTLALARCKQQSESAPTNQSIL